MDQEREAGPQQQGPALNTSVNQQLNYTLIPNAAPSASLNDGQIQEAQSGADVRDCSENRPGASARKQRRSQADILIQVAEAAALFHAPDSTGYADLIIHGHRETWPIRSKGFRDWLCRVFYLAHRRVPNTSALQDALMTIEGQARYDAIEQSVHLRTADYDGRIYIDLCDAKWRVVEVSESGWRVIPKSPVRFVRTPGLHALPEPARGSMNTLYEYLNVNENDRCLVLAWLVAALRPTGPYPILILQGEQGTAKSTAAKVLRSLVDPSAVPVRTPSRDERDLMIAARNGWCIALDNLSRLSPWLSDALCRIATGSGLATRALYSDIEEVLIQVQRPAILNGIDDIATRQDLIDRSIIINLEPIPEDKRRPEAAFWQSFNTKKPAIFGALLDRISRALRELPNMQSAHLSRMADFELWAMAAEPRNKKGEFIKAYRGNRQSAIESGLEGSLVATVLRDFINPQSSFEGTATALLNALNARVDNRTRLSRSWPKSARSLSEALRRLATALRTVGIEVEFSKRHGTAKTIRIVASPSSLRPNMKTNKHLSGTHKGTQTASRGTQPTIY